MNLFDILIVIAAFVILITALARLNDIKRSQKSKRWWVRRVGLLFVSVSMVMMIMSYFTVATPYWNQVMRILGLWGFALTWVTTPGMPPWWRWISRYDPKAE
ncbi:hypothetical protein AXL3_25 [Stenotrophomonas phage vB_SmaS-AXL_3]|uniref:Uncharacterized protein n=1 Tax=Stenotrophomonas phage vB_SmaS-AXL_3 TaxID=2740427 RepID=A0A7D5CKU8_9CAUD|nr:hypothetical protein PQE62_gp25 [Stenotrophomonas phage vB_SmaS-AXL_3]QKW95606.1 hypothetical protein AXL3_25 [Stenotrophomonas phage vB_SmaS-AXL_3]